MLAIGYKEKALEGGVQDLLRRAYQLEGRCHARSVADTADALVAPAVDPHAAIAATAAVEPITVISITVIPGAVEPVTVTVPTVAIATVVSPTR
jgi:hypothetical protein